MRKENFYFIVILIGGLFTLGFGIFTLSIQHMFVSGLTLVCFGITCVMLSLVGLIDLNYKK